MREQQLEKHIQLMIGLKDKHAVILELIDAQPVHYFDIPVHGNVGDLLIMQGTLIFFKKNQVNVKGIFSAYNAHEKNINANDVLVFHGGGNLGDLYEVHQKMREDFVKKYKNNRIIILPQTVYFESDDNYKKTCEIFNEHPDLHLCVRDHKSYALAEKMTKNVYLMPDMAHQLYPLRQTILDVHNKRILFFSRTDKEATEQATAIKFDTKIDWDELLIKYRAQVQTYRYRQQKYNKKAFNRITSWLTTYMWLKLSQRLVKDSITLFESHELIYTNRLHGHILACLLDIENEVLDNSYGKNTSYVDLWTVESPLVSYFSEQNVEAI